MTRAQPIHGVLFDKDGTLFDFQGTWSQWAQELLGTLAQGEAALAHRLAEAIDFDMAAGRFRPESPVIAGTGAEAADLLAAELPHMSSGDVAREVLLAAQAVQMVPAVPLRVCLTRLRGQDLRLGVATNDFASAAQRHLHDVLDLFDFVAGFDSGHGGKPAPGMLLAFADACSIAPAHCLMVGDSRHDLVAGRAAGMRTVAVLTGVAGHDDLADLADVVLPDIGHLPGWIDRQREFANA